MKKTPSILDIAERGYYLLIVPFYPLVLAITMPIRFLETFYKLVSSLSLKNIHEFARMSAYRSLNSSAHRAYDLFIRRYGRFGYAYEMGLGRSLACTFWLTTLSMRLYRRYEIIVPWLGVFIAVISQLIWLRDVQSDWIVFSVAGLGLLSSSFYNIAFESMKYDALGWALVPLGYHALLTGNLWLFGFLFFCITFLSVTVTIVQGVVWSFVGLLICGPSLLLALIPGSIKLCTHFRFLLRDNLSSINNTISGIGVSGEGAKIRQLRMGIKGWYFLGLFVVYLLATWLLAENSQLLTKSQQLLLEVSCILLYVVNRDFRRFADEQTLYMLIFCSFSLAALLQQDGSLLPWLWVALSPMPLALGFADETPNRMLIWQAPKLAPYHIQPVRKACVSFLKPVPDGQRIFFHFDYSSERYPTFDGVRAIKEFLHFLAIERQITIVPDFYLIYDSYARQFPLKDLYQDGSPQGRIAAMEKTGARFLLFPSETMDLPSGWIEASFIKHSFLDLRKGREYGFWSETAYQKSKPYLMLLEASKLNGSLTISGSLLDKSPNRLLLQLDKKGEAIIRLLYSRGWKSSSEVIVDAMPGTIPWIRVRGYVNSTVELNFKYY